MGSLYADLQNDARVFFKKIFEEMFDWFIELISMRSFMPEKSVLKIGKVSLTACVQRVSCKA